MDLIKFWVCLIGGFWLFGRLILAATPRNRTPAEELYVRRLREGAEPYQGKGDW